MGPLGPRVGALLMVVSFGAGCDKIEVTETGSFERAEEAYRTGAYKDAIDQYERFILTYPTSPLSEVSKMRLRHIRRELTSIMGRPNMPGPVYTPPPPGHVPPRDP